MKLTLRAAFLASTMSLAGGCSDGDETGTGGAAGSATSAASGSGAPVDFLHSACGACVATACRAEIDACKADPECPAFLSCLEGCPLDAAGNTADTECVASCPKGTGTESIRAASRLEACRDPGPGADCEACGVRPRGTTPPDIAILNQTCGASSEPSTCIACQDENCCETYAACIADPDCQGYRDCIKAAGDFTDACAEAFPGGPALMAPDLLCAEYHCAVDQPDCDRAQRDPCLECAYTRCTAEWVAFSGSAEGFLLGNCIGTCPVGDVACDQACYDRFPSARDEALAFGECTYAACGDQC